MNLTPISSLLRSPERIAALTRDRHDRIELLDEGDLRDLTKVFAAKFPHAFDAAFAELCSGGAA